MTFTYRTHHDPEPLVTVILRTHKEYADFLPRALRSIDQQNLPPSNLELIVAYDGEPDSHTLDILDEETKGWLIPGRLLGTSKHYGYYCAPCNQAIPHAQGYYLAFLDVDNEWTPDHLPGLLAAMREPDPETGWPHFAYSRREYVRDPGADPDLVTGPSPLVEWTPEMAIQLQKDPFYNFIDSSDFLCGKALFYELVERTNKMWNTDVRRFGDWELMSRFAQCGFRGRAVDQITNRYHWHEDNLQITRPAVGPTTAIPLETYDHLRESGRIQE